MSIELLDIGTEDNWSDKKRIAFEQLLAITERIEKAGIDITGKMGSDWYVIACVCALYGEKGKDLFHRISLLAEGYTQEKAEEKFKLAAAKNKLKGNGKLLNICRHYNVVTDLPEEIASQIEAIQFLPEDAYGDDYDPSKDLIDYGFFQYKNQYCTLESNGSGYKVTPFTNFIMLVKYHMPDKKNPRRIIEFRNNLGKKLTVDTPTNNISSLQKFVDFVEGLGNFRFNGGKPHLSKLKNKLYDDEKQCYQIETMGHYHDGFYVFCNGIFVYELGEFFSSDDDGIVDFKDHSYYVPSGNKSYEKERFLYADEKKFKHCASLLDFTKWAAEYHKVFGTYSSIEICFAIAALFSDIVFETVEGFPILFLYGEGSSGKGTRMKSLQRLFGTPQDALKISEKANTDKAKIREMAKFVNAIVGMEEYTNDIGDAAINTLKGLWDRFGYKRSVLESKFGTESVPINSAIIMTGNEYPTNDPFIQRFIGLEINSNSFSDEQKSSYNHFRDITQNGITQVTLNILKYRNLFEQKYKSKHRECHTTVSQQFLKMEVTDRMINNCTVLLATYNILKDVLTFPFKESLLLEDMSKAMQAQVNKRESGAVVQQFWDTILYCLNNRKLENGKQLEITGAKVVIQFKEVYPEYSIAMAQQRQSPVRASTLRDKLLSHESYLGDKNSFRFSDGRKTSAYEFEYNKLNVDLLRAVQNAKKHNNTNDSEPEIKFNNHENEQEKEF